jgi:hypothetical protein
LKLGASISPGSARRTQAPGVTIDLILRRLHELEQPGGRRRDKERYATQYRSEIRTSHAARSSRNRAEVIRKRTTFNLRQTAFDAGAPVGRSSNANRMWARQRATAISETELRATSARGSDTSQDPRAATFPLPQLQCVGMPLSSRLQPTGDTLFGRGATSSEPHHVHGPLRYAGKQHQ